MTIGLWIIIAFFVALCVLIGLGLSEAIPPFSDWHPSDRKWRKMCESPVFPTDPGDDSHGDDSPYRTWSLKHNLERLDGILDGLNSSLAQYNLRVFVCNLHNGPDYAPDGLISEYGINYTVWLETRDESQPASCRHIMRTFDKFETVLFSRQYVGRQLAFVNDWLEIFTHDRSDAGLRHLLDCAELQRDIGDAWFGLWVRDYEEAYPTGSLPVSSVAV